MKLGIFTSNEDLQRTRPWIYPPSVEDEEKVIFHLRPWTRSSLAIVEKRAKAKNIAVMDADQVLWGIGGNDKDRRNEAYLRELANYLIADWEGITFANEFVDPDTGTEYKVGDPMPCDYRMKVFLFENSQLAVDIVSAAQKFATIEITDDAKNSERSFAGEDARKNSPNRVSA
jgi:hypothetical protein